MFIYADDDDIVFDCEHCGDKERLSTRVPFSKRSFQIKLNKFNRSHHLCEFQVKRKKAVASAVAASDAVIQNLLESCR